MELQGISSSSTPKRKDQLREVRTENCGGECDRHIHPKKDPKGYDEPGPGGGIAVFLDARYDG